MKNISIQCFSYSIDADLYEGDSEKVLLVLHGWNSSKKNASELASFLADKSGATTLVIEYSGHGNSPFDAMEIRPAQHFLEVITAFDWIKENYPDTQISVMGTSYGGFLAVQLTKYRSFRNLVLRVPAIYEPFDFYTLNKNIDRQHERRYREEQDFLDNHPLLARASKFKGRTLVVWHEFDDYVPKELTDKYIEVFHADSYLAKGWKHSYKIDAPDAEQSEYKNAILDWIKTAGSSNAR